MGTWVALLRGINVGGRKRLAMRSLVDIFVAAGGTNVNTYIQSGNVVFSSDIRSAKRFGETVGKAIAASFGFCPAIHLLTADELYRAIAGNPYRDAESDAKSLHLIFLEAAPAKAQVKKLAGLAAASESFTVAGSWLYLHAPEGVARSRLARGIDRVLSRSATARNWRTVTRLAAMAAAIDCGAPR